MNFKIILRGNLAVPRLQFLQKCEFSLTDRAITYDILAELLCQIDSIDETIERFNRQIQDYCSPFEQAVELLDTIPGVARQTAELIVVEIGTDMSRFPTAHDFSLTCGQWLEGLEFAMIFRRKKQVRNFTKKHGILLLIVFFGK
jgi:hypothetical protein